MTSYLFRGLEWGPTRAISIFYDEDFQIPEEVQEEGLVLFYVRFDVLGSGWWPAPSSLVLVGGEEYSLVAAFGNAAIAVLLRNPDGTAIPVAQDVIEIAALRVILVPPGTVITPNIAPDDLIGLSYGEVTAALGIRE